MPHVLGPQINAPGTPSLDDEVIPTAIVIKNIPFNVKRETLLDIIVGTIHLTRVALAHFFRTGFFGYSYAICLQLSPRPVRPVPRARIR